MLAEQAHHVEQQVVEVHRTGPLETGLVLGVHVGVLAVEDVLGLGGGAGRIDQLVLPERDQAVHTARREALGVEAEVADDVAGQPHGVGLVVDRERARIAQHFAVTAQDPHARRVERGDPHRLDDRPDQGADPLAHLGRGLVGERDRQDLRRPRSLVDQVGDAMGQHAGLARAGSGHDQQRPVAVHHGVELLRVEPVGERAGAEQVRLRGIRHRRPILETGRRSRRVSTPGDGAARRRATTVISASGSIGGPSSEAARPSRRSLAA